MASRVPERHRPRARHSAPQFVTPAKAGNRPLEQPESRGVGRGDCSRGDRPPPQTSRRRAPLRHSRENGNPRTIAARQNGNREITKYIRREKCSAGGSSPAMGVPPKANVTIGADFKAALAGDLADRLALPSPACLRRQGNHLRAPHNLIAREQRDVVHHARCGDDLIRRIAAEVQPGGSARNREVDRPHL